MIVSLAGQQAAKHVIKKKKKSQGQNALCENVGGVEVESR